MQLERMGRPLGSAAVLLAAFLVATTVAPAWARIDRAVVQRAWERVAAADDFKRIPVTFEKSDKPNAWVKYESAEDFSVHVTQGLMDLLNAEDEIAGVLGHEIGHVRRGHYSDQVSRNVGWAILGSLLGKAGDLAQAAGAIGMSLAESGFSREQEVEADDYGTDLLAKAGYDPHALYRAMKRFKDAGLGTEPNGFNSHPPTDRRLKHLKERADRIAASSGKTSRIPDAAAPPAYKARAAHDGEIVPSAAAVAASVRNAAGYVANAEMGRTHRRTRRSQ